jgi:hypothetical protein
MTEFTFDGHACGLFAMAKEIKVKQGSVRDGEGNQSQARIDMSIGEEPIKSSG